MLFNSYAFLFVFLPGAMLCCRLADNSPRLRIPCLLLLSFAFYGYWDVRFLALLIPSIAVNWLAARLYLATRRGAVVTAAIIGNLAVLGYFKYANFIAANVTGLTGVQVHAWELALPLGISFFTFHHIMYLVDLRRGLAPGYPLDKYALYICFFPQVLSGPLVRWSEVMQQFGRAFFAPGWEQRFASGVTLIILGLAQKLFLADKLAQVTAPLFRAAETQPLSNGASWTAMLGFSFQIFFDFSGYTDIAIGTALILGIVLPINFNAPYRAASVREFWRRWHMTLSQFLRDYLYIPLGGNRHGFERQVAAILVTMTLGGLWHGSGWNFVLWGLLHGIAIVVAMGWARFNRPLPAAVGWALTFGFVTLAWVFFHAATFAGAINIFGGLKTLPFGHHLSGWRVISIAAFCALALPPSHRIVEWLTAAPRRSVAVGLGIAAVAIAIQLGQGENYEFVYFRF